MLHRFELGGPEGRGFSPAAGAASPTLSVSRPAQSVNRLTGRAARHGNNCECLEAAGPNSRPSSTGEKSRLVVPKTMPAYLINLGDQGAQNVRARLRNPPSERHNVFAEGIAPLVTKRGEAIGVLPWPTLCGTLCGRWTALLRRC